MPRLFNRASISDELGINALYLIFLTRRSVGCGSKPRIKRETLRGFVEMRKSRFEPFQGQHVLVIVGPMLEYARCRHLHPGDCTACRTQRPRKSVDVRHDADGRLLAEYFAEWHPSFAIELDKLQLVVSPIICRAGI